MVERVPEPDGVFASVRSRGLPKEGTYSQWLVPQLVDIALPENFQRTHERCSTLDLLGCEESQRIAHEDIHGGVDLIAARDSLDALPQNGECGQPEIGLRLATAGGHPDDVDLLAPGMSRIDRRR